MMPRYTFFQELLNSDKVSFRFQGHSFRLDNKNVIFDNTLIAKIFPEAFVLLTKNRLPYPGLTNMFINDIADVYKLRKLSLEAIPLAYVAEAERLDCEYTYSYNSIWNLMLTLDYKKPKYIDAYSLAEIDPTLFNNPLFHRLPFIVYPLYIKKEPTEKISNYDFYRLPITETWISFRYRNVTVTTTRYLYAMMIDGKITRLISCPYYGNYEISNFEPGYIPSNLIGPNPRR
jgi:hypothetical protein